MSESSGQNSNSSGGGNNRNRRRRRRPSGNNQNQGQAQGQNQNQNKQARSNQNQSGNKGQTSGNRTRSRRGGRNRRRGAQGNSQNRTPALHGIDLVRSKYLSLVEKHVEARRKYYDFFYRADPNQLRKLEKEFVDSQAQLLAYEESLTPEDRERLHVDYGGKPEDRVYSSNHEISPDQQDVPTQGDFEDPHVLESQKRADFKDDTEESVGTIDDYKKLKGLI